MKSISRLTNCLLSEIAEVESLSKQKALSFVSILVLIEVGEEKEDTACLSSKSISLETFKALLASESLKSKHFQEAKKLLPCFHLPHMNIETHQNKFPTCELSSFINISHRIRTRPVWAYEELQLQTNRLSSRLQQVEA